MQKFQLNNKYDFGNIIKSFKFCVMDNNILKIEHLSKVFNSGRHNEVKAVDNISLSVKRNSIVLFQGPSGSGKTTLLSIISCLSKPTSGSYICLDETVSRWPEKHLTGFRQRHIGTVFQEFNLITDMSALYNICLPLVPRNLPFSEIEKRALAVAEKLNISHRLHAKADTLSGGEKQRVAIARALLNDPEIVIADEPTAHLDSHLSKEIMEIFKTLKKMGKTIIIASHDPILLTSGIIDQAFKMQDGKLTG